MCYERCVLLQVAMPLLFQGHVELLEEYLSRSREHQAAFVQLIDELIDPASNTDAIVRCVSYHRCYHCHIHCVSKKVPTFKLSLHFFHIC